MYRWRETLLLCFMYRWRETLLLCLCIAGGKRCYCVYVSLEGNAAIVFMYRWRETLRRFHALTWRRLGS
jgi:hypothetical protein